MTLLPGRATASGTARYAQRASVSATPSVEGHFRPFGDLTISSIGFGLAAGEPTDEIDARYRDAIYTAISSGCNHFDAAVSYREQRSETVLGRTLLELIEAGVVERDELVIASKAGFIPYGPGYDKSHYIYEQLVAPGVAEPDELAGGIHCMAPTFLTQQINWSLRNLGLRTIDIYYLQNPETQLPFVDRATFRRRLQLAFAQLEEEVAAGRIGCYGIATWDALRQAPVSNTYMSLEVTHRLATEVAGPDHHLRMVQLPLSGAMLEAFTLRNQPVKNSILPAVSAARDLGLSVIASAALGQRQIAQRVQDALAATFGQFSTADQRSLQFVRSLPGVTSALFGSTEPAHVRENLAVAALPADGPGALRLAHSRGR